MLRGHTFPASFNGVVQNPPIMQFRCLFSPLIRFKNATDDYDQLMTVKKRNATTFDYLNNTRTRSYFCMFDNVPIGTNRTP